MPDDNQAAVHRKIEESGKFQVWIVDGSYIRGHMDEEFTNFGQHYRYPYIPEDEFWIDQEAERGRAPVLHRAPAGRAPAHGAGMPYDKALEAADRAERKERRRAGDLKRLTARREKTAGRP